MVITGLILLVAIAILVWGYWRARPYGTIGILAWLQSVALMAPWLLFFGLFALGIYINLAGVLLLLIAFSGIYIFLGRRLRALGKDDLAAKRAAAMVSAGVPSSLPGEPEKTDEVTETPEVKRTSDSEGDAMAIPAEDLAQIEGIFGVDTYFRTETIPYQQGAIFRGNLRGQPAETTPTQWGLAALLGLATVFASLEAGAALQGFDLVQDFSAWAKALPFLLALTAILASHEIGHWVLAQKHGVRLSPPFLIPTWQIGSFGSLTRFESLLPNRSVLFDIAFAGPAAGGLVSLALLLVGLLLSHPGSEFQVPAEFFKGSILVAFLSRVVLGSTLQQPLVDVHPLAIMGWLGLVITALNLMPAGQLDGGRIVQAIYGRKTAGRTTVFTLIVLALVSLVNPLALYWAVLILILQRTLERPCLDDITEPDDARAALGLLALFLTLTVLLPLTPSLAGRLGIGG